MSILGDHIITTQRKGLNKTIDFSPGSPARARIAKDFQRKKWKLFRKWFFKNFKKIEQHVVSLPYEENFIEDNIPTKARPCQMNADYLELCKKEIDSLLQKGLLI